jgi:hypothetical protein
MLLRNLKMTQCKCKFSLLNSYYFLVKFLGTDFQTNTETYKLRESKTILKTVSNNIIIRFEQ